MQCFKVMFTAAVLAIPVALAGCEEKKGPFERAGEKADKAAEKAGDELKRAGDEVKDAAKNPPPNQ